MGVHDTSTRYCVVQLHRPVSGGLNDDVGVATGEVNRGGFMDVNANTVSDHSGYAGVFMEEEVQIYIPSRLSQTLSCQQVVFF